MKNKSSIIIYAVIAAIFSGLSLFTDVFDHLRIDTIFSHFGLLLGLAISASVLLNIAKGFIQSALQALNK